MSLLDGKYEILGERPVGAARTLFDAAAPDGTLVLIDWFMLEADEEQRFEHYRRALKRLTRDGLASVYDVVSRPGAHYVAWHAAADSKPAGADPALTLALADLGFTPEAADIRRSGRHTRIYALAWDGQMLPASSDAPAPVAAPRREKRQPLPAWAVTNGLAVLLLVMSGLLLLASFQRHNNQLVVMPDVIALAITDAASLVRGSNLVPEAFPVPSDEPAGTVIRVGAEAGARLRPGRTVRLAYAFPPGQARPATVPRLKGLRYPEDVTALVEAATLRIGTVSWIHAETPEGIVISQAAEPDSTVGEDSSIDLLVSSGPAEKRTFLPDLQGLPVDEALWLASLAGLRADQVQQDQAAASGAAAGTVLGQSLPAWHMFVQRDAVLRLTVAAGREQNALSPLPSLAGMRLEQARLALPEYDIQVLETGTLDLPEGVIAQDPPAGSALQGGVLTVTVNVHPQRIPLPRPVVTERAPERRALRYNWYVEPGIGLQTAHVFAVTLEGDRILVAAYQVQGGDTVQGEWSTSYPGVVHFELLLNNEPYGGRQLAR